MSYGDFESYESTYEPGGVGDQSARLPDGYYTSAHDDFRTHYGSFSAESSGTILPEAASVLAKLRAALPAADAALADAPWGFDAQSLRQLKANVNKVRIVHLPKLVASAPTSASSSKQLRDWAGVAKAALSELDLGDLRDQGYFKNAAKALEVAIHTFVVAVVDVAEKASGIAGRAIIGPLLSSPLTWLALAGGAAWFFKAPLLRAFAKGAR